MVSANYPLSNKPLFVTPYKEVLSFASEREKSLKPHIHPKCIALRARQIWISCDTKLSNLLRSVIIVFIHYIRILHIYVNPPA